jgi:glyoxylase-like metal-dependent hydrolase (beta-lactamase superfamily II)
MPKLRAIVFVLLSMSAPSLCSQPAPSQSTTFRSYQKARTILAKSLDAHGGLEKIRALRNVTVDYDGFRTMINQSRRADAPWDKEPSRGTMVVDREKNRMYAVNYSFYPGIGSFGGAWAMTGTEAFHWEPQKNHHGSEIIAKLSGADTNGPWAFIPRSMPPFLLLSAWENNTNVRWIDRFERNGRTFDAISFVQRDRANLVVIIDAATNLVEGFEVIRDDGVHGDVTDFIRFSDYQQLAGVKFPTRRTEYLNEQLARELDLKFSVNTSLEESLFNLPEGYSMPSDADENAPRIKKIADGVYLDTDMSGVMIVEFKDFLTVIDCPENFWMSQSTIDALAETIPDKPIRYVVPSHTHGDHGGGARAYFHLGATLITTRGNVEFYRNLARIRQTINPDPFSKAPKEPIIETFRSKRIITDGTQILELYDVGPNAHSDELTIAYLPKQKLLWQADLVFNPMTGGGINRAMPIGVAFAKKLKELNLANFDRMVEGHHPRIVTIEDFRRSLREAGYTDF